tara:strand:+ start:218 stop:361 length:144 start_codon:yes stop_codon:yes gene_type:complete
MTKETYQVIKRISAEELRELLFPLDNVFDHGKGSVIGDGFIILDDCS